LSDIIHSNGQKEWCVNGLKHRDGGLQAYTSPKWGNIWYIYDMLHRDGNMPATDMLGSQTWSIYDVFYDFVKNGKIQYLFVQKT
jgi:hypothetical protein